ncbi:MAG: elongation factor P [Deltaproteobacteria bacterium]|nr:elongation factor P [Deltaproteobacteria bacterium]
MNANQVRPGMIVEWEGQPYYVMESIHRTPGNLRAFMQIKMRNIKNGNQIEQRFATSDRIEKIQLDVAKMQFLYQEGEDYHFMNVENYEQTQMSAKELGDAVNFLLPETVIDVQSYEGKAIGIQLPKTMDFKIIEAEPSVKKQTASSSYKTAKIETGLTVKVPPFVEEGDVIRIDTETHDYMERVNK